MPFFENNNTLHVLNFDQAYMSIFKLAYKVSQRRNIFYFFPCQSNINFHFFKFFKFYSVTFSQQLIKGDMVWNLTGALSGEDAGGDCVLPLSSPLLSSDISSFFSSSTAAVS